MIKHHVKEEEQPGGLFAKARSSDMDLKEIGDRLRERKADLTDDRVGGRKQRPAPERGFVERMLS
jgi:hypothetical protein